MGTADGIFRSGGPPPESCFVPILSPRPGEKVRGLIVCPGMVSADTHFVNNRSIPCRRPSLCEGCQLGQSWRWRAWLGVWFAQRSRYALQELTAGAARLLRESMDDACVARIGWIVTTWRQGRSANAPMLASIEPAALGDSALPRPFDVKKALLRVWGLNPDALRQDD